MYIAALFAGMYTQSADGCAVRFLLLCVRTRLRRAGYAYASMSGAMARNARPRWLIASFAAGSSSAVVVCSP